jgi:hypothetical protein
VLADDVVVVRITKAAAVPVRTPWLWTLGYGHHEDRAPTHGYEASREAAMAAFAKTWRRSGVDEARRPVLPKSPPAPGGGYYGIAIIL